MNEFEEVKLLQKVVIVKYSHGRIEYVSNEYRPYKYEKMWTLSIEEARIYCSYEDAEEDIKNRLALHMNPDDLEAFYEIKVLTQITVE